MHISDKKPELRVRLTCLGCLMLQKSHLVRQAAKRQGGQTLRGYVLSFRREAAVLTVSIERLRKMVALRAI